MIDPSKLSPPELEKLIGKKGALKLANQMTLTKIMLECYEFSLAKFQIKEEDIKKMLQKKVINDFKPLQNLLLQYPNLKMPLNFETKFNCLVSSLNPKKSN